MVDVIGLGRRLQQELTAYDQTFLTQSYPQYWGAEGLRLYHYSEGSLPLGAKRTASFLMDYVGEARIYDGQSTDIPLADFGMREAEWQSRMIISGARWHALDDLAAENFANSNAIFPRRDTVTSKMDAMKMAIDRKMHTLVVFGDSNLGMQGLFSGASVDVDEPTGITPTTMTANDVYDFFRELISKFQDDTLLTTNITSMMVSKPWHYLLTKRFEDGTGTTPYNLLVGAGGLLQEITVVNELKSSFLEDYKVHSSGTNKDRIVLGDLSNSQAYKRQFYPTNRTDIRLDRDGLTYYVTAYAATSESQFRAPYQFRYVDVPSYNFAANVA